MNQRISNDIYKSVSNINKNDLMDKKNFIASHPTRVNLLLRHLTVI